LILGLAVAALAICGVCAAMVGSAVLGTVAPRIFDAGPDGIDLRPTPGAIAPEIALPAEAAGYERRECRPVAGFRGVDLGPEVVEAIYTGPRGSARVLAARLGSYHDAARAVAELLAQLERVSSLGSHRLVTEEAFGNWRTSSGKRSFVSWHAPAWGIERHGFAWQSGHWCFIVASNDPVIRRDVTLGFPY
jgi:hypothetical protein